MRTTVPARGRWPLVRRRDLRSRRGVWRYVYRAVDQHGQVIDILVSTRRDGVAARRFFERVLTEHARPEQVTTDKAKALIGAIADVLGDVEHDTTVHANNRVESDHARLKPGCDPCAACSPTAPRASSSEGMRSSRTSDAGTTNSASTHSPTGSDSPPRSTSSPKRSEPTATKPRCAPPDR